MVAHIIIIRVSGITYQSTAYEHVIYTPITVSLYLSLSSSPSSSFHSVYKLIDIKDARVYIHQSTPRIYTVIFHAAAAAFTTLFILDRI